MEAEALQAGEVVNIRIEDVAFGGSGVGRVQGMAVFVPFTVTNDEVEVEIISVRKKFAVAEVMRILQPSAFRAAPLCRYFGQCGGCQLQHIVYEQQLAIKEKQVRDIFVRLGNFPSPPVSGIIPSPGRFHYRGKADYHARMGEDGRPLSLGFMKGASETVLDIARCEIVEESINRSCQALRTALLEKEGKYRHIIWSSREGGKIIAVPDDDANRPLIDRVVQNRHLAVPYGGFFQINTTLLDGLVAQVLKLAALTGGETVIDAYCGAGLFSLFVAPLAGSVVGIEINGPDVQCARENLQAAGFMNTLFLQGDVGEVMKRDFTQRRRKADVVILDPPRSGCNRSVLDAVRKTAAKKVIYISCNPATQARDMRYLVESGFTLECLQPLDMFPQTGHIEVIGLLTAQ
ncbi:MAG: class I SAM-dependent RNA methyltransferase [Deltaproteobacteria bacterium]|nr:class I SAM-dependent RNA methyltransferase [Deltaproteobacteria bacterium]